MPADGYPRWPAPSSAMLPTLWESMLSKQPSSSSTGSGPRNPRSIESPVWGPDSSVPPPTKLLPWNRHDVCSLIGLAFALGTAVHARTGDVPPEVSI